MEPLQQPWLVAAWPGMGGVALIAATHLTETLGMKPAAEVDPELHFDVQHVAVEAGLMKTPALPRSTFYGHRDPKGARDLLVMLGQRQPEAGVRAYCATLLDEARRLGASRVITFAAMGTYLDPRAKARVFAAATSRALLDEAVEAGAEPLQDGQISGLNGVFLAEAAERGMEGLCLLGEIPFFASTVANPKASAAALRVFAAIASLDLDLARLDAEGKRLEQALVEHLRRLERSARSAEGDEEPEFPTAYDEDDEDEDDEPGADVPPAPAAQAPEPELEPEVQARIDELFGQAARDRSKALELKAELDRHGLFRRFEDRFLDLFKQAG